MNRCRITYEPLESGSYSSAGLRKLHPRIESLLPMPFDTSGLLMQAAQRMPKMSVQGVQPKLSVVLSVPKSSFQIVDIGGEYILKPPHPQYAEVPELEDLTMHMASAVSLRVPFHMLVDLKDGNRAYVIRRFDRLPGKQKRHVEDFAQVTQGTRSTKYNSSVEKIVAAIQMYCSFPLVEKQLFFKRALFAFIAGDEDMHLKNVSLEHGPEGLVRLTPVYDHVPSSIVIKTKEESALPLNGKKSKLTRNDWFVYLAKNRMGLPDVVIDDIRHTFSTARPVLEHWISISFASDEKKEAYLALLTSRFERLGL